jgi:DNA integrity scanning protein DisA with diadenylate cyclase activity
MMDRDEFLQAQREASAETENVISDTLAEFHETADADNSTIVTEYLADFHTEVAALRETILKMQKETTLNTESLLSLIKTTLAGR